MKSSAARQASSRLPAQPSLVVCKLHTGSEQSLAQRNFLIDLEPHTADISLVTCFIWVSILPKRNSKEAKAHMEPEVCSPRTKVPAQVKLREGLGKVKPLSPGSVSVLQQEE